MNGLMRCKNIEKKNSIHVHGTHALGGGAVHSIESDISRRRKSASFFAVCNDHGAPFTR